MTKQFIPFPEAVDLSNCNTGDEPLNYLAWIDDLATYGTDGYAYNNINILLELQANSNNAISNKISAIFLLEGVIQGGSHVGEYFKRIIPSNDSIFDSLETMTDIANNETAMNIVLESESSVTSIAFSESAITIIATNESAMTAFAASESAMTIIASSETAMSVIVEIESAMTICLNSTTARIRLHGSEISEAAIRNSVVALMVMDAFSTTTSVNKTFTAWNSYDTYHSGKVFVLSLTRNRSGSDCGTMSAVTATYTEDFSNESLGANDINRMYEPFAVKGSSRTGTGSFNVTVTAKWVVMD